MTGLAWLASTRDLRWRWRRFLVALVGTSLALAVTLLLSGFRESIDLEARHLLRDLGADALVMREGSPGPLTTTTLLDASLAQRVARQDGVTRADPLVSVRHTIDTAPAVDVYLVYLIGGVPGGLGLPGVSWPTSPPPTSTASKSTASSPCSAARSPPAGWPSSPPTTTGCWPSPNRVVDLGTPAPLAEPPPAPPPLPAPLPHPPLTLES